MSDLYIGGVSRRARVLPVVYLGILDHHLRRTDDQQRVIGALLGQVKGLTVEITNCFPVPCDVADGTSYVDMNYLQRMLELFRKVNQREIVVGWYATGSEITQNSVDIHDLFIDNYVQEPVHLLVDTSLKSDRIGLSAVMSSPMGAPNGTSGKLFAPVECQILLPEPERVALSLLDRSLSQQVASVSLVSDLDHVAEATDNLYAMIGKALDYVEKVLDGSKEGQADIGRALRDTIAAVPKVDPVKFEAMFNNTVQDLLMLVYLANLTQSQVMLQDKMNEFL